MFKTLRINEENPETGEPAREVFLKFPVMEMLKIRDTAADIIGDARFEAAGYKVPKDRKVPVEVVLHFISELDVMLWLFGQGLAWANSGAKPEEAKELYDRYMDVPEDELDTGEHLDNLQMAIGEALAASRGINLRKNIAKKTTEAEEALAEAEEKEVIRLKKELQTSRADETIARINLKTCQDKLAAALSELEKYRPPMDADHSLN